MDPKIENLLWSGWLQDQDDSRDYTLETRSSIRETFERRLKALGRSSPKKHEIEHFDQVAIKNQGNDWSCSAQAGATLLEYCSLERTRHELGADDDLTSSPQKEFSPAFIYKCARKLARLERVGTESAPGCEARFIMKSLVVFGAPPLSAYPYDSDLTHQIAEKDDPDTFTYAYAQNFQALKYYRLDIKDRNGVLDAVKLLKSIKKNLCASLPIMFAMRKYQSCIDAKSRGGEITFLKNESAMSGGHAMVVIGYDDKKKIGDSTGAFRFRNSYGSDWGDHGHGWLPYDHVLAPRRTADWWCLIDVENVKERDFIKVPRRFK